MADEIQNGAPAADDVFLKVDKLCKYFTADTDFFGKPVKFLKAVDGVSFSLQKGDRKSVV